MKNKMFTETFLYNKSTNLSYLDELVGSNVVHAGKIHQTKYWKPPLVDLLNGIQMPPCLVQSRPPRLAYRDSTGSVLIIAGKIIGDHHILVTEILSIREAIMIIIQK